MGFHKILKIIVLILSLIGIVLLATILTGNDGVISAYMSMAYIVLALAIIFTLVFSLTQVFTNKENLKKTLISLGLFLLIIAVSYALAEGNEVTKNGVVVASESASKWVGAGLMTFYALAAIAIGAMIYSGIRKLIKS